MHQHRRRDIKDGGGVAKVAFGSSQIVYPGDPQEKGRGEADGVSGKEPPPAFQGRKNQAAGKNSKMKNETASPARRESGRICLDNIQRTPTPAREKTRGARACVVTRLSILLA